VAQVIEPLLNKLEILSSNACTKRRSEGGRGREGKEGEGEGEKKKEKKKKKRLQNNDVVLNRTKVLIFIASCLVS
jgi:hypothetical protein